MPNKEPFFIGWAKKPPRALWPFLFFVSAVLVGGMGGMAFSLSASVDDPGDGRFAGRAMLMGVIEAKPYPLLRLPPDDENPEARAILLSGPGKRGVQNSADPLSGKPVLAMGAMLKRGTIDMLQVNGRGVQALSAEKVGELTNFRPAPAEDLGRWRLVGEICDGKCYQGAMRPSSGLAHKACANFCLIGGTPPVFVSTAEVQGSTFFLLADQDGNALPETVTDLTALLIEIEGVVEKRDNLMIFKIDLDQAKVM
ncbi:MAG: hypothetical protein ABJN26_06980 [Stappiaceae bacterium]